MRTTRGAAGLLTLALAIASTSCAGGPGQVVAAGGPAERTPSEDVVVGGPAEAEETATPLEVEVVDRRGVLAVSVVSVAEAGKRAPVASAQVEIRGSGGPAAAGASAGAGAEGRYIWHLAPGAWSIQVSAPGYRTARAAAVVQEGEVAALDMTLDRA